MVTAILPPTGEPFAIVGTAEAKTAIEDFRLTATEMLDGADEVIDGDRGRVTAHTAALLAVLAHRDDLVAENARLRHGCKSAREMLRREDSNEINDAVTFLEDALSTSASAGTEAAPAMHGKSVGADFTYCQLDAYELGATERPIVRWTEDQGKTTCPTCLDRIAKIDGERAQAEGGKFWAFVITDPTGILMLEHAPELREHIDARGDVGDYLTAPAPGLWFWEGTAAWSGGTWNGHEGEGADLTLKGTWKKATVRDAITTSAPEPVCRHCLSLLGDAHTTICAAVLVGGADKIVSIEWCDVTATAGSPS